MKTIYSICATSAIFGFLSYGIFNLNITAGGILLGIILCIFSFSTIIFNSDIPNYPYNKALLFVFLGVLYTLCWMRGLIHTDGLYWLISALMIAILSIPPTISIMYFALSSLGTMVGLLYVLYTNYEVTNYNLFHAGCVVIFTLSCCIRVYINYRKGVTH